MIGAVLLSVQVFFSPGAGGAAEQVIKHIQLAEHTYDLAMFDLNEPEIVKAIMDSMTQKRVNWRIVADRRQAATARSAIPKIQKLCKCIKTMGGLKGGIMHNKFGIADGQSGVTGSFNWTSGARQTNHENLILFDLRGILDAYITKFNELWFSK